MNIIIFGDSITQGFHDDEMNGWCTRLSLVAQKKTISSDFEYDTSVFNMGISGDNTDDLVSRIDIELKARIGEKQGAVVFAVGVNDSQYEVATNNTRVPLQKFQENMVQCINQAKNYTDKIYFLTLLPVVGELLSPMPWKPTHGYSQRYVDRYNEKIKQIASDEELVVIDVSDVLGENFSQYLPDGIHPNAEGHRLIFEKVKSVLETDNLL